MALAVSLPDGSRHQVEVGSDADGSAMSISAQRPVTSITKTMTAAVALQLVDEGLLSLDAPLSEIPGAGPIPGGQAVTVRQLLDHSSGIAPYQEAAGYNAGAALTPLDAVRSSLATPLQWAPGTQPGYSNSGFLSLGLLIEAATGRSYADVLAERVLAPNALTATALDNTPTAGWVGSSAGGVVSTVTDLVTWGENLYRDGSVLSPEMQAQMLSVDETLVSGLGAFPVCPCRPNGDGSLAVTSVGHNGGSVTLQFSPGDGIVIAAAFSESFWTASFDQSDVYRLLAMVRDHVSA